MKVNYYIDASLQENHVDVYYRERDAEIESLMGMLDAERTIYGKNEESRRRLYMNEIYYVEVVDRHCFAYLQSGVYEIETSLKSFLEHVQEDGFIQIGKATAVNIHRIKSIVPDFNMRMHLTLENGEQLVLNRAFKKNFMEYLKRKREEWR